MCSALQADSLWLRHLRSPKGGLCMGEWEGMEAETPLSKVMDKISHALRPSAEAVIWQKPEGDPLADLGEPPREAGGNCIYIYIYIYFFFSGIWRINIVKMSVTILFYTIQCNLQTQCNFYQITSGISHRIKTQNFTICMGTQMTLDS